MENDTLDGFIFGFIFLMGLWLGFFLICPAY